MSRKQRCIQQRREPLFRQFTTIIKIHTEIRCENMNRTEKTQNGSCVIKLITIQSWVFKLIKIYTNLKTYQKRLPTHRLGTEHTRFTSGLKEIQTIKTNTWTTICCHLNWPESGQKPLVIVCPSSTIELRVYIPAIIFNVALIDSFEVRFQYFYTFTHE